MALSATALVIGKTIRTSSRDVVSKKSGETFTIRNAVIVGDHCMADVRIPDGHVMPVVGSEVTLLVELSAYNGDAECNLVQNLSDAK